MNGHQEEEEEENIFKTIIIDRYYTSVTNHFYMNKIFGIVEIIIGIQTLGKSQQN